MKLSKNLSLLITVTSILSLSSFFALGSYKDTSDCISITQDLDEVQSFQKSGVFRSLKSTSQRPKFNYDDTQSFDEYLKFAREKILHENPKGTILCPLPTKTSKKLYPNRKPNELAVVDLISPFELPSVESKTGILLVHGLTDSPYMFHDLSMVFHEMGITVRTLLLPGHGTAPDDLIDVSEKQWRAAAQFAVNKMLKDFDQVLLGGFSTGGALMIDQALNVQRTEQEMAQIKGVMLWAPAIKAKSNLAWAAKYVDAIPFIDYESKSADVDFAKYESFPFKAAAQVYKLMKRINKVNIPIHDIPMFVVASESDQTISTLETIKFLKRWSQARVGKDVEQKTIQSSRAFDTLVYYGQNNIEGIGDLNEFEKLGKRVKVKTPACAEDKLCNHVIDISHNAAPVSPSNPFYGVNGVYKNCEHLLGSVQFSTCKSRSNKNIGEIKKENLVQHPSMARLTFNPYFDETAVEIKAFIATVLE